MKQNICFTDSPVGKVGIIENGHAVTRVFFAAENNSTGINIAETELLKEACRQLQEYFAGNRKNLTCPLHLRALRFN